jgi:hypothetical protein
MSQHRQECVGLGSAYVAVAVNIVALSAEVNTARARENRDVNTMTSPMRTSMLSIKNNTSTVVVGRAEEITVTVVVLVRDIRSSEYRRKPGCVCDVVRRTMTISRIDGGACLFSLAPYAMVEIEQCSTEKGREHIICGLARIKRHEVLYILFDPDVQL